MKKIEEKEKEKDNLSEKNISPQLIKNFNQSKQVIEKYKIMLDELMKEEQQFLEKLEKQKKNPKNRSVSAGKMKIFKSRIKSNLKGNNDKKEEKKDKIINKEEQ